MGVRKETCLSKWETIQLEQVTFLASRTVLIPLYKIAEVVLTSPVIPQTTVLSINWVRLLFVLTDRTTVGTLAAFKRVASLV